MKSKLKISQIIIFCSLLLFPLFVNAANISLPFYRDFENDEVDTAMDDGNCMGLDYATQSRDCVSTIRDDYTAREGSQYLEIKCDYVDCDHRQDAFRCGNSFEGLSDGLDCHVLHRDDGTEYWIAWSNYIPSDYYEEYWSHMVFQIFSKDNFGDPGGSLWVQYYGGDEAHARHLWTSTHIYAEGEQKNYPKLGNWTDDKGTWVDWVFHIVYYTSNNANARFELFKNGESIYDRGDGLKNLPVGAKPYVEWILYNTAYYPGYDCEEKIKQYDTPHSRAVYVDSIRIYEGAIGANGYCDAAPAIWPGTPSITAPTEGLTDVSTSFTSTYSGYTDHRTDAQGCFAYYRTQIQVDEDGGDWSSLVYDSGSVSAETSNMVSGLSIKTSYQLRVRHSSFNSDRSEEYWGEWSKPVTFTTSSVKLTKPSDPPPDYDRDEPFDFPSRNFRVKTDIL